LFAGTLAVPIVFHCLNVALRLCAIDKLSARGLHREGAAQSGMRLEQLEALAISTLAISNDHDAQETSLVFRLALSATRNPSTKKQEQFH
jgi:hypothetical protein